MNNDSANSLDIICLPKEYFPTDRAILSDLWNKEISQKNNLHWVMFTSFSDKKDKWANADLTLIKLNKFNNPIFNQLKLLLYQLRKFSICLSLFKKNSYDYIFVRNGIFESLMAIYFQKRFGSRFCFHLSSMHGYFDNFQHSSSKWPYTFLRRLRTRFQIFSYNFILKKADVVIPISEPMSRQLVKKVNNKERIISSPLGASKLFLDSNPKCKSFHSHLLKGNIKLLYVGSMGERRDTEFLVKTIKELKKTNSGIVLNLLGSVEPNEKVDYISVLSRKYDVSDNVNYISPVDYHQVPNHVRDADIGVISIPPEPKYLVSSPTKFAEFLSVGIPVVFNREIHLMRDISQASLSGIGFDYSNVNQCVKAINFLIENPRIGFRLGQNGRSWMKKNYSNRIIASKIIKKMNQFL